MTVSACMMHVHFEQTPLGLPWYCEEGPQADAAGELEWVFRWTPPESAQGLHPAPLRLSATSAHSFETLASDIERQIGAIPNLICGCCALVEKDRCPACLYATGFHVCRQTALSSDGARRHVWKKGTLHDGPMDFQRVLWNLHRRGVPTEAFLFSAHALC